VRDLGVISRTSARQYDRAGKTMKKIGEDLGVDYVVEGSVRFAQTDGAARVRITSLLIRASDDTQLWSETYDRTIDDVFTVQTEIANKVVQSLGVTLGAEEHEMVASVPTENMEAYEAYIRAKDYIDPSGDPVREDAEIVRLLERAVELDPEFYEAWAQLSCHHSEVYNSPFDKTESRIDAARDALRKAEALDPDHPRTHLARGEYLYYGFRNYEEALEEFLAATRKAPNNADAWALVGYIYRRQGKWQQHIETLKKSLELDPQNENTAANLAGSFQALREFETAREYFDLAIELAPEAPFYRLDKALLIASATGDREAAMAVLEAAPPSMPRTFATGILNARFRRFDEARANLAALPEVGPTLTAWQDMLRASMTYTEKGRDAAMDELRTSEAALREILATAPSNTEVRSALALVLAMQGRGEEAVGEARLAADLEQKDRFQGPDRLEALAAVYAQTGRHQEAIDLLEELLETNYSGAITRYDLEQEAVWDPLRDRPRFKALVPPSS
jgi:tetratricopeptide (TPR) repeat protein